MPSKQVEDVYNASRAAGEIDARGREIWQVEKGKRCGCGGSDDMCGCQNNAPITEPRIMPDEIVAWPSNVTASGQIAITGGWSANQYFNDEAVRYVRADKTKGPKT